MKRILMSLITGIMVIGGVLCCIPAQQNTPVLEDSRGCTLQRGLDNEKIYSVSEGMKDASGTGWVALFDENWKLKKGSEGSPYELHVMRQDFKGVDVAYGSIMVMNWDECPTKFISGAVEAYIMLNDITPLKDAVATVGNQTWYVFVFKTKDDLIGTFAATAKGDYGFTLECITSTENVDDTVEICSDFIASFRITAKETTSKKEKVDHEKSGNSINL